MRSITSYIPTNKESAVSREMLCKWTGLSDRVVRSMIEKARNEGVMILNFGQGYYISEDVDELQRYYAQERRRAVSILCRLKTLRKKLKEAGRL